MKMSVALHYIFLYNGIEILKDKRLVYLLDDYGVFGNKSWGRQILFKLIEESYLYDLTMTTSRDKRTLSVQTFLNRTGYDKTRTINIIHVIHKAVYDFSTELKYRALKHMDINRLRDSAEANNMEYSPDGKILLYYANVQNEISDNCVMISIDSFYGNKLKIPSSVKYISEDISFDDDIEIINESPYFKLENGLFMTADKRRLIKCLSRSAIVEIPKETEAIDMYAFPRNIMFSQGVSFIGRVAPYMVKINNTILKPFYCDEVDIIASSLYIREYLIRCGINADKIYTNVYVDSCGVIYSADKKILICYPQNLNYTRYEILDTCERIGDYAFCCEGLYEWDAVEVDIEGVDFSKWRESRRLNKNVKKEILYLNQLFNDDDYDIIKYLQGTSLEVIKIPRNVHYIGENALLGLTKLREIEVDSDDMISIIKLLLDYDANIYNYNLLKSVKFVCCE